jgi:hypothetical protein
MEMGSFVLNVLDCTRVYHSLTMIIRMSGNIAGTASLVYNLVGVVKKIVILHFYVKYGRARSRRLRHECHDRS